MTRISKRLKAITSYVAKDDKVVDVGCDHGLLSIYLIENNLGELVRNSPMQENINSKLDVITLAQSCQLVVRELGDLLD